MKKIFFATAAVIALAAGLTQPASAKVNFDIHLGIPFFDYQAEPDYLYDEQYGWYDPSYEVRRQRRNPVRYGLSCGDARQIVRSSGYRQVRTRECQGRTFTFTARRGGNRILVYVNSRTGNVWTN